MKVKIVKEVIACDVSPVFLFVTPLKLDLFPGVSVGLETGKAASHFPSP